MKNKILLSLVMAAMTLIACNKENPFTPELSVNSTSDIQISSAKSKAHLTVTANLTWTAASDANWVKLTPASKQITDKTSNTTELEIDIDENSATDARTAIITIKAEGCKDIAINVKQAAKAFSPSLSVVDDKGAGITAPIEVESKGGELQLKVVSNISWKAEANASWLTVSPIEKQNTSKNVETTAVKVTIPANTGQVRSATITFKAEGCKDVTINVKQTAFAPTFSVVDDKGAGITAPIEVESKGGELQLKVVSNISWKAEASASWLTVSPIEKQNTSKNIETTDVKVTISANTGQVRNATITFKAEGQNDIVVTVNQKSQAAISIDIKVSDVTFDGAKITWTPSDNNVYCFCAITSKQYYSQFKSDQEVFDDDYNYYVNEVYPDYADEYTLEEFLFGLLSKKGSVTNTFVGDLKPETTYVAYAYVMNNDGNGKASLGSKVYTVEFTTAKQSAYTGELVLGDYLMSDPSALDQPSSNVFKLASADMGETNYYIKKICFQGDTFNWKATYDKTAGTLTVSGIAAGYESEGCLFKRIIWQIGDYLSGYWSGSNTEGNAPLVFSVDSKTKKINGLISAGIGLFAAENNNGQYEIRGFFGRYLKESTKIEYQVPATTGNDILTNSKKPVFTPVRKNNISNSSVRMK